MPFGNWVPWHDFTIFVQEKKFRQNSTREIQRILNQHNSAEKIQHKLHLMKQYAPAVLWHHPNSTVAENVLRVAAEMATRVPPPTTPKKKRVPKIRTGLVKPKR
eukprot:TRINITY_DN20077_c0_g1_i1.p2 TRINITY_DN20077_c0_g1~~TRINITY_DN20077_c0_g1_i1.p2  ORF type:complete len:104 (-),score=17.14 TRINITY_DN20077_c0_g1_i1:106-417(-)